jgi:hypothetical protein
MTTDMIEGRQSEITLTDVDPDLLKMLLDYMYGKVRCATCDQAIPQTSIICCYGVYVNTVLVWWCMVNQRKQ